MFTTNIITGKILLRSGLHIGGNKDTMQIGGIDNPVIKNPLTNMPYIPGSSLKGKMRFLLEHYNNFVQGDGKIPGLKVNERENKIAIIFGHLEHTENSTDTKPTRIIFSDCNIIGARDETGNLITDLEYLKEKMLSCFVETKTEVTIDRITGTAKKGGLRSLERVPAGVVFDLHIVLKNYEDSDKDNLEIIKKGLKLLENDALGGSGSRGSGRIEFFDLQVDGASIDLKSIQL